MRPCLNSYVTAALAMTAILLLCCSKPEENKSQPVPAPYSSSKPSSASNSQATISVKGEPGKPQSIDVISGNPVNKTVYGDYSGQRVYFCCSESKVNFEMKTQAYLDAIKKRGILLEQTPGR